MLTNKETDLLSTRANSQRRLLELIPRTTREEPYIPLYKHYDNAVDAQLERDPLERKSFVSETKKEAITRSTSTQPKQKKHLKKPTPKESPGDNKTITSMFDAMKRKLTPDKEADTIRSNQKVQRNEDNYES